MKKVLFILLSLMVVGSMAFGQVAFGGALKSAFLFWPGESMTQFVDVQLNAGITVDKYTKGAINLRAKMISNNNAGTLSAAPIVDKANFETNLAGYFDLTGITLKLSGGYMDLTSGKIASINNFQLTRVEFNLGKVNTVRLDVGIPVATLYVGTLFNDVSPLLVGLTGSIAGVQYEAAYAKTTWADNNVGNIMVQAKYGLRLPEKMLLVIAGGVNMDLDDTVNLSNNLSLPAGQTFGVKYVAALRYSLPVALVGFGVDFGVDFNGSTEEAAGDMDFLFNGLAFDLKVNAMDFVNLYAGFVFDINAAGTAGSERGLAYWYALVGKTFGAMDIRVGYAARGLAALNLKGNDFRLSLTDNNDNWTDLSKMAAESGSLYLGMNVKF